MKYNKIAVFGCKSTTKFLIDSLHTDFKVSYLITINEELGRKNDVADYCRLKDYAESIGIKVYEAETYALKAEADRQYINSLQIDIAFVMGWQRLIPNEVLSQLSIGAFGMHGSSMNLPLGRGRSPMNWSIIEDRKIFYTNLFKYDPGVDSGDIVDTFKFQITDKDTGETMHYKNTLAMKYLVMSNIEKLMTNNFALRKQNENITPSYYPKRSPSDSLIDWNQDVFYLERFIRAVTKPFNGAFTFIGDRKIIIWEAQVFDLQDFGYVDEPAGTVVEVFESGKFLVKCFGGLLLVTNYSGDIIPNKGNQFGNSEMKIKYFERNVLGNHDLFDIH